MKLITLKSIVAHDPIALNSYQNIASVLEVMAKHSVSSVIIVDEQNHPIGIFTERDALRVVSKGISYDTSITEVMTPEPFCVDGALYLHDAYVMMEEKQYRHLVVVNSAKEFVGVVSEGDFLRHIGFEQLGKFKIVAEAMSNSPLIVSMEMLLSDVASVMHERKCDYAVVLDCSRPIGVVTERDITHWYAQNSEDGSVEQVLQDHFRTINKDIPLQEAAALMEEHGTHQLIVVDGLENLVGLLSRHDVLHAINGAYFEYLIRVIDQKNEKIVEFAHQNKLFSHFKSLLDVMPDPVFMKDEKLQWIYGNTAILNLYGIDKETYVGKVDIELLPEEFAHSCTRGDERIKQFKKIDISEEHAYDTEGKMHFYEVYKAPFLDERTGKFLGLVGIGRDITERKEYEKSLEFLANYDPLTGLANRGLLQAHLQNSIDKAKRDKGQIALLMFDLDRFKDINDSYGHAAGDELLKMVSERFTSRLREGDLIARLGGDEFAVVLENIIRSEDAGRLAEEMMNALSQEYRLSGNALLHIGASAGIVLFPDHGEDPSTLLQHGDAALYKAKAEGRGVYHYYTDELTALARKRIECETMLRRAVVNQEFEVFYQPQVHLQTGRIVGAEALIRWNCPIRGRVSPLEFIPVAEEIGLIGEIGEWVLNETCRQGKIWLDQGHRLTLAVNVSAHQVRHQNIPQIVENALKKSGYPADRLELELTESALMQREEETVAMLHALRAHGIRLAIDDFGTGYSSLSYLKRFPIDVLKIDKSFVDDIPYERDDMAIVTAIIAMGQALGFQVLAEGTERIEQIEFLREKGCTMYQGYYKSPPVKAEEFEQLLLG
jgi:diguanylate cyclase (GGDEF)-like protein/PAS domain S-box-containing protein